MSAWAEQSVWIRFGDHKALLIEGYGKSGTGRRVKLGREWHQAGGVHAFVFQADVDVFEITGNQEHRGWGLVKHDPVDVSQAEDSYWTLLGKGRRLPR